MLKSVVLSLSIILLSFTYIPLFAQEEKFKQTLDSIDVYIKNACLTEPVEMLTHYKRDKSGVYLKMSYNHKTRVVFSDGNEVFMIDFKEMDSSFVQMKHKLVLADPKQKVMFRRSSESRLFSGKIGGVDANEVVLNLNCTDYYSENDFYNTKKLIYFLKQATIYSKKVKTDKKLIYKDEDFS